MAASPPGLRLPVAPVSGRSSGVEHNLAKVGVGRSNRLARSIFLSKIEPLKRIASWRILLPRSVGYSGEARGKHNSEFRGALWRLHCGILNHPIPRCKGWLGVCPAWSAVGESIQSNCPLRLSFEAAELGPKAESLIFEVARPKRTFRCGDVSLACMRFNQSSYPISTIKPHLAFASHRSFDFSSANRRPSAQNTLERSPVALS